MAQRLLHTCARSPIRIHQRMAANSQQDMSKPPVCTVLVEEMAKCPQALYEMYPGCVDAWERAAKKADESSQLETKKCMRNGALLCIFTVGCGVFCLFFSFRAKLQHAFVSSFAEEGFTISWYPGGDGDKQAITVYEWIAKDGEGADRA